MRPQRSSRENLARFVYVTRSLVVLVAILVAIPVSGYAATASPEPPDVMVSVTAGLLSADVHDHSLRSLLTTISERAGIVIAVDPKVSDSTVSAQFAEVPLEQALRRLLMQLDAFFLYSTRNEAPASLRAVWVFPAEGSIGTVPTKPEDESGTSHLERDLRDVDVTVRERALEQILEMGGPSAQEGLRQGLADIDEGVRRRTLSKAADLGVDVPVEELAEIVRLDGVAAVRRMAVEVAYRVALRRGDSDLTPLAQLALDDPDVSVRAEADRLLNLLLGEESEH